MLRDLLRILGASCILAGSFLFYYEKNDVIEKNDSTNSELQNQLTTLQNKLDATQKELANLQTATSVAEKSAKEMEKDEKDKKEVKPLIKTVLSIQSGTNSSAVTNSLVRQGILTNNSNFETYLAENNLNGKIQIGEYDIDSSMDIETIAKIITKDK